MFLQPFSESYVSALPMDLYRAFSTFANLLSLLTPLQGLLTIWCFFFFPFEPQQAPHFLASF